MIPRSLQITIALLLAGVMAAGLYLFNQRERAKRIEQRADPRPVAAPVGGPAERITVLMAYDDDEVLRYQDLKVALPQQPNARAREVLRVLLAEYVKQPSPHPLGEKADVRDVYFVEGGLCVVDMNQAFADQHRSGILAESFTLASMVETISINVPGVSRVKFLVEGKDRETLAGHADLSATYEVAQMKRYIQEMQ